MRKNISRTNERACPCLSPGLLSMGLQIWPSNNLSLLSAMFSRKAAKGRTKAGEGGQMRAMMDSFVDLEQQPIKDTCNTHQKIL